MVWNLDDTIKKQKYNLNGQNIYIYVSVRLPAWFLFLATIKWAAEFRKLQAGIIYQPIMKLIFITLSCFPVSFYCALCMCIRKLFLQRESIWYVVRRYFYVSEFALLQTKFKIIPVVSFLYGGALDQIRSRWYI